MTGRRNTHRKRTLKARCGRECVDGRKQKPWEATRVRRSGAPDGVWVTRCGSRESEMESKMLQKWECFHSEKPSTRATAKNSDERVLMVSHSRWIVAKEASRPAR